MKTRTFDSYLSTKRIIKRYVGTTGYRSPHLAQFRLQYEHRTHSIHAKRALYHMSYDPVLYRCSTAHSMTQGRQRVSLLSLEPSSPGVSDGHSTLIGILEVFTGELFFPKVWFRAPHTRAPVDGRRASDTVGRAAFPSEDNGRERGLFRSLVRVSDVNDRRETNHQ